LRNNYGCTPPAPRGVNTPATARCGRDVGMYLRANASPLSVHAVSLTTRAAMSASTVVLIPSPTQARGPIPNDAGRGAGGPRAKGHPGAAPASAASPAAHRSGSKASGEA
jgi:hypothetical protein